MGFFVNFRGVLHCSRCGRFGDTYFQTKLLRHEADNCSREYRVGDTEEIVGLDDYFPLNPWDGAEPLAVIVGDWACSLCPCGVWQHQWAKLVLEVQRPSADVLLGTLTSLETCSPVWAANLDGVHFLEDDLALMIYSAWPQRMTWGDARHVWTEMSPTGRVRSVVDAYRSHASKYGGLTCFGSALACPALVPASARALAEAVFASDQSAVGPLSDALLECGLTELAEHFGSGVAWHPPGCWALDHLTGRT